MKNNNSNIENNEFNFIKIPNGIITLTINQNSFLNLTYLFLIINRNMLGKTNSSVIDLQETYLTSKKGKESNKTKAEKINKIISALYILSNTIVDENKKIISNPIIEIPKYKKYFDCCEFEINDCYDSIENEKEKLLSNYQRFQQYKLSIKVDNSNIKNNYTVLSIDEYLKLMSACFKNEKDNQNKDLKIENLVNIYLYVKMKLDRNHALNTAFPNGWTNKEFLTVKKVQEKIKLSTPTIKKYLDALVDLKLLKKGMANNISLYSLNYNKEENN